MRQSSLVSVIIPTFNYGCFITDALRSVFAQTYKQVEIIVVDDGSQDNTREIVSGIINGVRYYYQDNQGVYSAINLGLKEIRGTFFICMGADDILDRTYIEKCVDYYDKYYTERLAFVYTQHETFGLRRELSQYPEYNLDLLKQKNYIMGTSLINTAIARKYYFDLSFNQGCGDYDFYLTLAEHGYHGVLLNAPLLKYRIHENSITSSACNQSLQKKIMKKLIKKHRRLYDRNDIKRAMQTASDKIIKSVIQNRSKHLKFNLRFKELCYLIGAGCRDTQLVYQILHTVSPNLLNEWIAWHQRTGTDRV